MGAVPGNDGRRPLWSESGLVGRRLSSDGSQLPVDPPFKTLPEMVAVSCAAYSERPLFGTKDPLTGHFSWMSYREFEEMYTAFRASLVQLAAVEPGTKIAVVSKNRVEWAAVTAAALSLGCPVVPMYENQTAADWGHILQDSGAGVLCVSSADVSRRCDDLDSAVTAAIGTKLCFDVDAAAGCDATFAQYVNGGRDPEANAAGAAAAAAAAVHPDDLASLIYTSGTTGAPKGVMLSHNNIATNVLAMQEVAGGRLNTSTRTLSFLPWAHVFGQTIELYGVMSVGGAIGLAESPQTLLDDIQQVKPTVLVAVPVVFNKIYDRVRDKIRQAGGLKAAAFRVGMQVARARREWLDMPPADRPSWTPWLWLRWQLVRRLIFSSVTSLLGGKLKMCFTGGAALSPVIQQWYADLGIPIMEGYGLTETSPIVVVERFGPTEHTQGGMQAIPGVSVLLCKPDAAGTLREVGCDEEGEICVIGPNVMMGYYNRPDATAEAIVTLPDDRRAFRTGDLGRFNDRETGRALQVTGRANEQYKLENGKFVVPGPIEDTLRLWSPFVDQAFVYGLNRPHNVMLVVPDFAAVAAHLGLEGAAAEPNALTTNPDVMGLFDNELESATDRMRTEGVLPAYAAPQRIELLSEAFSVENGLLTPKLSTKRKVIAERYADTLDTLYTGSP